MLTIQSPINIDMELAEVLTDQYNSYAGATDEFFMLEPDWVLAKLLQVFDPVDLEFLIDDDYGRGLVMGQLLCLYLMDKPDDGEEHG